MRCGVLVLALILGVGIADVIGFADQLVRRNGIEDRFERGAFLISDARGVSMLEWPFERRYRAAQWRGPLPPGVAAVIHTHPNEYPHPSNTDRAEARRIGLPIFVATRSRVCVATPSDEVSCVSAKARPQLRRVAAAAD